MSSITKLRKGNSIVKALKQSIKPDMKIQSKYDINNHELSNQYSIDSLLSELNLPASPTTEDVALINKRKRVSLRNIDQFNANIMKKANFNLQAKTMTMNSNRVGLLGTKVGMISMFGKWGERIPVSIIKVESNQITNIQKLKYSYQVQVGAGYDPKASKPVKGNLYKHGIPPKKILRTFKVSEDCLLPIGYLLTVRHFKVGQFVDIQGISKGKGTEGVMARWGFKGGVKTHGNSLAHRTAGSIGNREFPARVWPGKKMAGKTGNEKIFVRNLRIFKSDYENGLIYVKGGIPGMIESEVLIRDALVNHLNQYKFLNGPTFIPEKGKQYENITVFNNEDDEFEKYEHDNNERLGVSDEEEEGPTLPEDEEEI